MKQLSKFEVITGDTNHMKPSPSHTLPTPFPHLSHTLAIPSRHAHPIYLPHRYRAEDHVAGLCMVLSSLFKCKARDLKAGERQFS